MTLWSIHETGNRAFIGPVGPEGVKLAEAIPIDLDPAYGPAILAERRAVARMVVEAVNALQKQKRRPE